MKARRVLALALNAGAASGGAFAFKPAAPQIIQCPGSDEVRKVERMASGNTFGRRLWTDGFVLAPMLPSYPRISRCAGNGPMFWVEDRERLGELPFWPEDSPPVPQSWRVAEAVRALTEAELLDAIDQQMGTTRARLLHLRQQAWWLANDSDRRVRSGQTVEHVSRVDADPRARANLEALVLMFDESDRAETADEGRSLARAGPPRRGVGAGGTPAPRATGVRRLAQPSESRPCHR